MRISDWSSDVCSSDLLALLFAVALLLGIEGLWKGGYASGTRETIPASPVAVIAWLLLIGATLAVVRAQRERYLTLIFISVIGLVIRSEEHTSELQSLMRITYAVFCLKKKNKLNDSNTLKNTDQTTTDM